MIVPMFILHRHGFVSVGGVSSCAQGLKHTRRRGGFGSTTGLGGRRKLGGALAEGREGVQRKAPLLAKNARNGAPSLCTQPLLHTGLCGPLPDQNSPRS